MMDGESDERERANGAGERTYARVSDNGYGKVLERENGFDGWFDVCRPPFWKHFLFEFVAAYLAGWSISRRPRVNP